MVFRAYINLMRPRQWYKNLVIFVAIFFLGQISQMYKFGLVLVGFVSLCFASSAGYIINDLVDLKKDRLHPEKKFRPLAAGKIRQSSAVLLAMSLLAVSLALAASMDRLFLYSVLALFLLTQAYTFVLKKIMFADILLIATLFVVRAVSATFILDLRTSPWLILCPFFLSLFLSVGKRQAELDLLKADAPQTRSVLRHYDKNVTNSLMVVSTTLLMTSYTLYSFLSSYQNLLYTLPVALFVIFRYFYLINSGSEIARHPERISKDNQMVFGILLWVIITYFIIYSRI